MRSAALLAAFLALPAAALAQDPAAPPTGGPAASPATAPASAPSSAPKAPSDPDARPTQAAAVLEEVTGTVAAVDRAGQKVEIATAKGPVTLNLDRNTLVYSQGSLGTVLDLAVGQPVRAGRNAASTAYWVQLRPAAKPAPAGPSAGPGPAATPPSPAAPGPAAGTARP